MKGVQASRDLLLSPWSGTADTYRRTAESYRLDKIKATQKLQTAARVGQSCRGFRTPLGWMRGTLAICGWCILTPVQWGWGWGASTTRIGSLSSTSPRPHSTAPPRYLPSLSTPLILCECVSRLEGCHSMQCRAGATLPAAFHRVKSGDVLVFLPIKRVGCLR